MFDQVATEIELLQASVDGDTSAFEKIVENYQAFVCGVTYSATGDVGKSEELAQETFINAWKGLGQLKDLRKFRGWLSSITRNIIRDSFKRQNRNVLDKAVSMEQLGESEMMDSDPVDAAISEEQQAAVRQALQQIPVKYREPLVLFYRQDQSVKEVAKQLELSEEAVRTRLSRGSKLMRKQVEAMVEATISRTGPSKVFTASVIATISGMVVEGSGVAAASGVGASSMATGLGTIMGGIGAKIVAAAAVVVIGVGAVITYQQVTKPDPQPVVEQSETIGRETKAESAQREEISPAQAVVAVAEREPENSTQVVNEPPGKESIEPVIEPEKKVEVKDSSVTQDDLEFAFVPKGVLSGLITDAKTGEPVRMRVSVFGSDDILMLKQTTMVFTFSTASIQTVIIKCESNRKNMSE